MSQSTHPLVRMVRTATTLANLTARVQHIATALTDSQQNGAAPRGYSAGAEPPSMPTLAALKTGLWLAQQVPWRQVQEKLGLRKRDLLRESVQQAGLDKLTDKFTDRFTADKEKRTLRDWLHEQWVWDVLLLGVGAGAGVAGYALLHEPLNVRLEHVDIHVDVGPDQLPRRGLKILQLSDTHFRGADWREDPKINQIHKLCRDLDYDLLVHTGDFLHYDSGLDNVKRLLAGLPKPRLGSYAVLGNHDYMTYSYNEIMARSWAAYQEDSHQARRHGMRQAHFGLWAYLGLGVRFAYYFFNAPLALKRSGPNSIARLEAELARHDIQMLYNRAIHLGDDPAQTGHASGRTSEHTKGRTNGDGPAAPLDLWLAGVDDLTEGTPNLETALTDVPHGAPLLLLAHNPGVLYEPAAQRAQVILSGHTHGGQIVLPFVGAAHTQTAQLRRHHVSGLLRRGNTQIYITRGIGEGIPIRFAAPPQIALITLYPKL